MYVFLAVLILMIPVTAYFAAGYVLRWLARRVVRG